mgnify:CR=1 FL=1
MIAILVVSMVQGVFAQQIIIKGTVKDATSKKAAEYVNVVLQQQIRFLLEGLLRMAKAISCWIRFMQAIIYWHYPVWGIVRNSLY